MVHDWMSRQSKVVWNGNQVRIQKIQKEGGEKHFGERETSVHTQNTSLRIQPPLRAPTREPERGEAAVFAGYQNT